jgi:hypothetical protein
VRCLAAKHAELKEGAMREDAALAASKRRICMRYGFWRRFSIGDDWGGEAASGMSCALVAQDAGCIANEAVNDYRESKISRDISKSEPFLIKAFLSFFLWTVKES